MTLTEYLNAYLGDLVTQLSVSASAISFAVAEAISEYSADTEEECTDLTKLHKIANVKIWLRLMLLASASFDVSADGASYKTSQVYDFLKNNWLNAVNDASEYMNVISISQHRIDGRHKHYDDYTNHYC